MTWDEGCATTTAFALYALLITFLASSNIAVGGPLQAAASAVDISPDLPVSLNGGMSDQNATAINDPLHARALVLFDGVTKLALVECDSCMIPRLIVDAAIALIENQTDIGSDSILIGATHAHSTPTVAGVFQSEPDPHYVQKMVDGIVLAVLEANSRLEPAKLGWAVASEPDQVFNRRWHLKNNVLNTDPFGRTSDKVRTNPAAGGNDLIAPAGPVDPDVTVLSVVAADDRPIALFANYSLHYVGGVPGNTVSADYFGRFAHHLASLLDAEHVNPPFVPILTNGSSGDINNISFLKPHVPTASLERIDIVSRAVAAAAVDARRRIDHTSDVVLDVRRKDLDLGVRRPTSMEVSRARDILTAARGRELRGLDEIYARETLLLADWPEKVNVAVRAIRIGELAIVTIPCEVFVEVGLEIKRRSPFSPTCTWSLAGGYHGYLPTEKHHSLGGYETWRARSSYLEESAAKTIVDVLAGFLDEFDRTRTASKTNSLSKHIVSDSQPLVPETVPDPAASLKQMNLPEDFTIELVACEPAVIDPVAVTFDHTGRPYVVEYRDYPLGPPAGEKPLSRVVRLDDLDGDSVYESSTVAIDNLSFAQGILALDGGLLVTAAPDILLFHDRDGDGRFEERRVVATGLPAKNPQLRAACPKRGIDNWVSITGGLSGGSVNHPNAPKESAVSIDRRDFRIDLASGRIEPITGVGQFGNAFDSIGRRYTSSNRNPSMVNRFSVASLSRNDLVDVGSGFEDASPFGADSRVYPIAHTTATAASHTGTHTSACGIEIFRGDLLGQETVGDIFVCEPVSHLVTRRRPEYSGSSISSRHVEPDGTDFLASTDSFFSPVFASTAPDGSLWICDMCRGSVEHPDYMPPGLAETLDLRRGDNAGRIWRIRKKDSLVRPWSAPINATMAAALLHDPNGWRRDTAQRLLVEHRFPDAAEAVIPLLEPDASALATLHALWTLEGLGELTGDQIRLAASSKHTIIRETSARLVSEAVGLRASSKTSHNPRTMAEVSVDEQAARETLRGIIALELCRDSDAMVRFSAVLAAGGSHDARATLALSNAATDPSLDLWISRAIASGALARASLIVTSIAKESIDETPERLFLIETLGATAAGRSETDCPDTLPLLDFLAYRTQEKSISWIDIAALSGLLTRRLSAVQQSPSFISVTLPHIVAAAENISRSSKSSLSSRCCAVRLLGSVLRMGEIVSPEIRSNVSESLHFSVGSQEPAEIQSLAVSMLVRGGGTSDFDQILAGLSQLEWSVRDAAVSTMLDRAPSIGPLLASVEAGTNSPSMIPLQRRAALEKSADESIRNAAIRIFGTATGAVSAETLADFVSKAHDGGDFLRGQALFLKQCANCHRISDAGHSVGPDLAEAADRPPQRLVSDILEPNRAVESRWQSTIVITNQGEALEGLLTSSGSDSVILQRPGGERNIVARADIDSVTSTGRSLMPDGFGKQLSTTDMADLITFLKSRKLPPVSRNSNVSLQITQ